MVITAFDPSIAITVIARTPLLYACGQDLAEDRPAHVRAASAICRWNDQLIVIQDDANWIASIDDQGQVSPLALPRGEGGLRLFGDDRGNKKHKLDLEAATVIARDNAQVLLAFGSGSTRAREGIVMLDEKGVRVIAAHTFYAALRSCQRFAGSELNVEGAVTHGADVLFLNRGNGEPRGGLVPTNAMCAVNAKALVHYLDDVSRTPPELFNVSVYNLGEVEGTRLTFTDATVFRDRIIYVASAEASPNAVDDGPVAGVAIGALGSELRYGLVRDASGDLLRAKIEGVVHDRGRWLVVVDVDDSQSPAELLELRVEGL